MKQLSLIIVLCLSATVCFAEMPADITLATTIWAPYQYRENDQDVGIATDIVKAAAERLGVTVEVLMLPWKRALKSAEEGKVHGLLSALYTDERGEYLYYTSPPLFHVRTVIFARKDGEIGVLNTLDELRNIRRVGVVAGYSYGEEFDALSGLTKLENRDDEVLVQNLAKGRVDVAVAHEDVFNFYSKRLDLQDQFHVVFTLSEYPTFLCFSKHLENDVGRELAEQFSQVLQEMEDEGMIADITRSYLK